MSASVRPVSVQLGQVFSKICLLMMLLHATGLAAQTRELDIRSVIGIDPGTRPLTYDEILRYADHVSRSSPRARLREYGSTALGRRLFEVAVSSPHNLERLSEIERTLSAIDSNPGVALPQGMPAVAWMGYGIHSDELSGSDAGARLIERLVTAQDGQTLRLLDNLVIHIEPVVNPDGRARFLDHVTAYQRRTPVTDAQDVSQTQFWPPMRFNHYLMDLNRDALFVTQAQSAARVGAIRSARPQLFVDSHEMHLASTFLFAVPAEPLNPYLPPIIHRAWQRAGEDIGRAFDATGTSYYTRSWNEVFYPGYYDILPAYSGITPILYEQGRSAGTSVRLPTGRLRTFADAVDNLFRASMATLTGMSARPQELLIEWRESRRSAARDIAAVGPKAWIVPAGDEYKMGRLREILRAHEIGFQELELPTRVSGLHTVWSAESIARELPSGTVLVSTAQPNAGLVRNLFDFHVPMEDTFLRVERERVDQGRATQIYDITAWSLPLAFDMRAFWSSSLPPGQWRASAPPPKPAISSPGPASQGYLFTDSSLFATMRLMHGGAAIRVATEAFVLEGREHPEGTFLLRAEDQSQDIGPLVSEAARLPGTRIFPARTARVDSGPDLGDDKFVLLQPPRVGVFVGEATQAASVGAMWQLFDEQIRLPVTLLDAARVSGFDLSQYNVLVLPEAENVAGFADVLRVAKDELKAWIASGGTLIAQGTGVNAANAAGLTAVTPRALVLGKSPPQMFGLPAAIALREGGAGASGGIAPAAAGRAEDRAPVISEAVQALLGQRRTSFVFPEEPMTFEQWSHGVPDAESSDLLPSVIGRYLPRGAYLRVDLKQGHWLRYGASDRFPALFREPDALIAPGAVEVVGRYAAPRELVLAGLVWPEAVGYIADTAYLAREKQGNGQFVAFAGDAAYRGYSLGTQRLLLNAIALGPGMRRN